MIAVRRARLADAAAIGEVHVAAWRSAYPAILPAEVLNRLSAARQAGHYGAMIRAGVGVHVADDAGRIVGFVSDSRARAGAPGEGEIETLYVLDDWRERGLGRGLMHQAASHLIAAGCRSAFLWVLRDNPSRWFYERLGGKLALEGTARVGGTEVAQMAYVWPAIAALAEATSNTP